MVETLFHFDFVFKKGTENQNRNIGYLSERLNVFSISSTSDTKIS